MGKYRPYVYRVVLLRSGVYKIQRSRFGIFWETKSAYSLDPVIDDGDIMVYPTEEIARQESLAWATDHYAKWKAEDSMKSGRGKVDVAYLGKLP